MTRASPTAVAAPFAPVADAAALDALFSRSHAGPVLLFQHDPWCSGSALAHRQLARLPGPVALVDVARQQELSRAIATRTGVQHTAIGHCLRNAPYSATSATSCAW